MRFSFKYYLLLFFLSANAVFALKPTGFTFKNFTLEDGLSQSSVISILHDQKGYLWFGTVDGLNRYDGYEFKIYRHQAADSSSVSDNGITALYEDKDGLIWIGTMTGALNCLNRKTENFIHYHITESDFTAPTIRPADLELNLYYLRRNKITITSITEDKHSNLWIGTWDNGIFIFNKNTKAYSHIYNNPHNPASLSCNQVTDIYFDKKGTFWISTFGGGLNRLDIGNTDLTPKAGMNKIENLKFIKYKFSRSETNSLSSNFVTSLFSDSKKNLWIGTYKGGLNFIEAASVTNNLNSLTVSRFNNNFVHDPEISNSIITDIAEDLDGYILAGTFGSGLLRINAPRREYEIIKNDPHDLNSLAGNEILTILADQAGIIWIGTSLSNGICKVVKSNFKFSLINNIPGSSNSLNDPVVWSIFEDDDDNLWIGTYAGGVNKYNRHTKQFSFFTKGKNGLSDKHIRAIKGDKFGNIWIGTFNGGLNRIEKKSGKITRYSTGKNIPNSLGANQIQSLYVDMNSTLWIGTYGGGLNSLDLKTLGNKEEKFKIFRHNPSDSNSISDDRVYSIYEDKTGIMWIGTYGGGLNRFDRKNNRFKCFKNDPADINSISENRIMSICEDSRNNLWIGTNGGGLDLFDREKETFRRFNDKDGLTSNVVYGILEDDKNNLWLSTDNGIFKFDVSSPAFIQYTPYDGLQSREFNGGAYFKNNQGEIFFGGINGLNYFQPWNMKKNVKAPEIVINKIKVFNTLCKGEPEEIRLTYDQNFISFEFAALDFKNPGSNQYSYKLEGFDKEWHYTDAKYRIAHYTNLPHGSYVFRVRGTNNDGVWNEKGASVRLIIAPPYWLSWWFILLCFVAVSAPTLLLIKFRLDKKISIEKLKTKLAADIHDNIGAGLTEISILSELVTNELKGSSANAEEKLKYIARTARKLVDDLSDIVWVINPNQDSLYDLILRLKYSYDEVFSYMGITFKTDNLEKLTEMKLSMEYRQNLYLIFKEGINNCIKHSHCKKIELHTNVKGNIIQMSLKDDGQGLPDKKTSRGNGLINIKTRAKIIGGKVYWHSVPDEGTTVNFIGKIEKKTGLKTFFKHAIEPLISFQR